MNKSAKKVSDYINTKIDSLRLLIKVAVGASDFGMETFYTYGPGEINLTTDQTLVPEISDGNTEASHFFSSVTNSGQILAPLLIILALLYFIKIGLRFFDLYHNKKSITVWGMSKVVADLILGLVMLSMATFFILGYFKVLVWIYAVEATVGIFKNCIKIVKVLKDAKDLLPEYVPGTSKLQYRLECTRKCFNDIKTPLAFLLLSGLVLALTIISCVGIFGLSPIIIPAVMAAAQIVLWVIIIPLTVQKFKRIYGEYKKHKATLESGKSAEINLDHKTEVEQVYESADSIQAIHPLGSEVLRKRCNDFEGTPNIDKKLDLSFEEIIKVLAPPSFAALAETAPTVHEHSLECNDLGTTLIENGDEIVKKDDTVAWDSENLDGLANLFLEEDYGGNQRHQALPKNSVV